MELAQSLGKRECKEAEGSVMCCPKEGQRGPWCVSIWAGHTLLASPYKSQLQPLDA